MKCGRSFTEIAIAKFYGSKMEETKKSIDGMKTEERNIFLADIRVLGRLFRANIMMHVALDRKITIVHLIFLLFFLGEIYDIRY